ncbi:serine/threonine-protein kinase [Nocardia arthritidis]|uniref:serine/threonine-protein kinase n=1 Tax=Nocardia arthritidis TaxID=228602 RepID=UPI001EECB1C3|nr:serine/threonine-protein kinase [Nocardia arthritidis]
MGETFAGYVIEDVLGQGGMGTVYLARHPRLPRMVALKLLNREVSADPEIRARFEREANVVARLDHPGIVGIHDRGVEDDRLWIAMQYIEGVDAAKLNPRTVTVERAVRIVGETAAALDYAHSRGVLHRDIKPGNILLSTPDAGRAERAVLTDFGIARMLDTNTKLTATGTFSATLAYASPEQLTGADLDHRSDQYSLGCTLYALLAGETPFSATNPGQIVAGHLSQQVPPLTRADVPPRLHAVIARAMSKRPAERFASCGEFAAAAASVLRMRAEPGGGWHAGPPRAGMRADQAPAQGIPGRRPGWLGADDRTRDSVPGAVRASNTGVAQGVGAGAGLGAAPGPVPGVQGQAPAAPDAANGRGALPVAGQAGAYGQGPSPAVGQSATRGQAAAPVAAHGSVAGAAHGRGPAVAPAQAAAHGRGVIPAAGQVGAHRQDAIPVAAQGSGAAGAQGVARGQGAGPGAVRDHGAAQAAAGGQGAASAQAAARGHGSGSAASQSSRRGPEQGRGAVPVDDAAKAPRRADANTARPSSGAVVALPVGLMALLVGGVQAWRAYGHLDTIRSSVQHMLARSEWGQFVLLNYLTAIPSAFLLTLGALLLFVRWRRSRRMLVTGCLITQLSTVATVLCYRFVMNGGLHTSVVAGNGVLFAAATVILFGVASRPVRRWAGRA